MWYIKALVKGGQDLGVGVDELVSAEEVEGITEGGMVPEGSTEGAGWATLIFNVVGSTTRVVSSGGVFLLATSSLK